MSDWLGLVVAAVVGGPIMWLLHRFDRRNTSQHAQAQQGRTVITDTLNRIETVLLEHVTDRDAHR